MFPQTHPRSKFSLYSCLQKIIVFDTSLQSVCSSRCFQSQYYTLIPQSHKFLSEQQDLAVHTTFASSSYRAGHSAHYKTLAQNCKQQLWFWGPIWWLLKHLSVQRKKIQFVWQKSRTDLTNWFGSNLVIPHWEGFTFTKGSLGMPYTIPSRLLKSPWHQPPPPLPLLSTSRWRAAFDILCSHFKAWDFLSGSPVIRRK